MKRKPHFILTGGKRPPPPVWAESFQWALRDETGHAGVSYTPTQRSVSEVGALRWINNTHSYDDIIAVRWL